MNIVAIILARGGSKGIPKKNIIDFCGKPLLAWTIQNCLDAQIPNVYVSTDDNDIARVANKYGAIPVYRPSELASDTSTAEESWANCLKSTLKPDIVVAAQVTSPLRTADDIRNGISMFIAGGLDSLFSASPIGDMCLWKHDKAGNVKSINYDYKNRKRRQELEPTLVENGSFYIFKPETLSLNNNRLGGKIGFYEMEFWKMFEVDDPESLRFCKTIMKEYLL